ncbi:MAG: ABC transporter ATP-binding protein [Verrucomicrobiota bacterium]
MTSDPAIKVRDLRVDYGNFVAVDDISFTVPKGEVLGLVGPNGAGKTSTFRVLATLMEPTYGEIRVAGIDISEEVQAARRILGYMPDLAPVPSDLKAREFLNFHAQSHSLGSRAQCLERADECLATVNLEDKHNAWCRALSRGETQRLVLAKTMLHHPQVLILDEPASGLDPFSRRELRLALQNLARQGATVIVSSHILTELTEMCSSICIMNQGRLLASGSAEEVRRKLGRSEHQLTITVLQNASEAADWLRLKTGVHDVSHTDNKITCGFTGNDEEQTALLAALVTAGYSVKTFEEQATSFEDILVEVAEGNRN